MASCPNQFPQTPAAYLSPALDEERKELWDSVLEALKEPDPDPARAAACSLLLRHLLKSSIPY